MFSQSKKCPQCAETVRKEAVVCKHCSYVFPPDDEEEDAGPVWGVTKITLIACCLLLIVLYVSHRMAMTPAGDSNAMLIPADTETGDKAAFGAGGAASTTTNWAYREEKDEMRGAETRFATDTSENSIDLPFPYSGGSSAEITLRRRQKDGLQVIFSVTKGQILCTSYSPTHLDIKFDKGPVRHFECSSASEGDSTVAFLEDPASFTKQVRKASNVIIEAPLYKAGREQWSFKTSGLIWK